MVRSDQDLAEAHGEGVKELIDASKADATKRAYGSDWQIFETWCSAWNLQSLPATSETVCAFLSLQAQMEKRPSTLSRRLAAIQFTHRAAKLDSPTSNEAVKAVMSGIRRKMGSAPTQKAPATAERLKKMVSHCPPGLQGLRDRAILLLGFSGAFRRSELAALTMDDIEETEAGMRVYVRNSKTDQEGAGAVVAVIRGNGHCPVRALNSWLKTAGILEGPIFRPSTKSGKVRPQALSPYSIGYIVKKYAALAGFDEAEFSGHSLRAGFLTSAAENGASVFRMMDVSRHKSVETVRGYVRRAEEFKDHAGKGLL